jgi:uncharacterized membrane protein YraQ (UPF0718 family)
MIIDIILAVAALGGLGYTFVRDRERFREAWKIAGTSLFRLFPAVCLAIFAAALLVPVLPGDIIAHWIGPESGIAGVAIASIVGAFIPGGPVVSFPLLLVFQSAGAGTAQLITLLSAWSVVAIHRLVAFEVPLMGPRFTGLRLLASIPLPFMSGLIALLLV